MKEKSSVFLPRVEVKPYEYPEVLEFMRAIRGTSWFIDEFRVSLEKDKRDYIYNLNDSERGVIKRAMLAISQIEVAVKDFWAKVGDKLPKPEIKMVGYTFAHNEVVHQEAYSEILTLLNLENEFKLLLNEPVIKGRVDYLTKYLKGASDNKEENYTLNLLLFSAFIESCSLFSQFYLAKSFCVNKGLMTTLDNIIMATAKEENCFVEGTEVLTQSGWKLFEDLTDEDLIMQYDNGRLEAVKPLRIIEKDYEGDVIKFNKRKHSTVVTPNHDMVYYTGKGKEVKVEAKDFIPDSKKFIPEAATVLSTDNSKLTEEDKLRIAIQADGSLIKFKTKEGVTKSRGSRGGYNYTFSLTKKRKKDRLINILNNLGIEYHKEDKGCKSIIKFNYNTDYNYKEFKWVDLSKMNKDKAISFCDELSEWDGYKMDNKNCKIGYSSTVKYNIDIAQVIGIFAGYRTSIIKRVDNRKNSYKDCYKLSFTSNKDLTRSHSLKKEFLEYKGKVRCVTVPSGKIMTRYNNETFISGNCHFEFGTHLIKIIRAENPEWFNEDFYNKIRRACRKAYEAEVAIVDWMIGDAKLDFISKDELKSFLKSRFNSAMKSIDLDPIFEEDNLHKEWFEEERVLDVRVDFFDKQSPNYTKNLQEYSKETINAEGYNERTRELL